LGFVAQPFSLALSPPSIPKQERKSNQFIQSIVTAKQENTILHQYSSLPRERNHTGCLLPTERATPVPKKKSYKRKKINENASLPFVNLHLYDDIGSKRAKIYNFGALFKKIGFERFFEFFFVLV
jgi:hypothetical protein